MFRKIVYQACPNLESLSLVGSYFGGNYRSNIDKDNSVYVPPAWGENRNLKKLSIKDDEPDDIPIPVSWVELFSHFNQLETFEIDVHQSDRELCWRALKILEAIRTIRHHDDKMLPFKTFELYDCFYISGGHWQLDQKSELNMLKELNLTQRYRQLVLLIDEVVNVDSAFVKEFLQLHSNSLIKIDCPRYFGRGRLDFPFGVDLFNLEEFAMPEKLCSSMEFLPHMKNLKELTLGCGDDIDLLRGTDIIGRTLETDRMSTLKLENLKILHIYYFVNGVEDVKRLVGWLPNVEEVAMLLDDEQFAIVCQNWGNNLKELAVFGDELTDEGITGRKSGSDNDSEEEKPLLEHRTWPGIASLKGK